MEKEKLPQEIKEKIFNDILALLYFNDLSQEEQWNILEKEQEKE